MLLPIPIGTERRLQRRPWVTWGLIATNCFVYFLLQGGPEGSNFPLVFQRLEWWMPVTHMFAHGGLLHLLGNMLVLWVFGPHAEDALGRGKFLVLYFSAGFASAALHLLASAVLYPENLAVGMLGASGAVMGVVALFVLRFHGVRVRFFLWWILPYIFHVRALWVGVAYLAWDVGWALTEIGSGGGPGVAHWAHVGGFLAGAVWAWALRLPEEGTHKIKHDEVRGHIAAGAWRAAAELLEERIEARPGDASLHAEAAACYEMLREQRHLAAAHWNEHLRLLLLHGRTEEALERFRLLTDAFRPGDFDPAVLMRLGAAAESRGENEPAVAAWMAAAQAHPDSPQAAPAALRAARVFLRHDSPERAAAVLELIQRRWPDTEEALTATSLLREVWRGGET